MGPESFLLSNPEVWLTLNEEIRLKRVIRSAFDRIGSLSQLVDDQLFDIVRLDCNDEIVARFWSKGWAIFQFILFHKRNMINKRRYLIDRSLRKTFLGPCCFFTDVKRQNTLGSSKFVAEMVPTEA